MIPEGQSLLNNKAAFYFRLAIGDFVLPHTTETIVLPIMGRLVCYMTTKLWRYQAETEGETSSYICRDGTVTTTRVN